MKFDIIFLLVPSRNFRDLGIAKCDVRSNAFDYYDRSGNAFFAWARNRDVEGKWWARFCTCVQVCRARHRAPSILPDVCEIYHAQPRSSGLVKLYVRLISRVMTRFSAHINPRIANDVTATCAVDLGSILTPGAKNFLYTYFIIKFYIGFKNSVLYFIFFIEKCM